MQIFSDQHIFFAEELLCKMFWPHLILEWIYLHESQTNRGFINANSINLIRVVRFALPRKDCDEFIDCHYSESNRHLFKIKYQIFHTKDIFQNWPEEMIYWN